ncbi:Trimeric LpxA-like protein [Ceratocystis lukuohia]|uniref:Dynactin subunit 6 n=1 Tax=Ceratocystis lukuohia TaxID=2019550 RepID=A0ABR4MPR0_9PEZI
MSKRHSIVPSAGRDGPRPPTKLSSSLVIADTAILVGTHNIVIMSESVVHPRCRLDSTSGGVFIGSRCIIQERVHLGARSHGVQHVSDGNVMIGDYVTIEATAVIETGDTQIGEGSVIGIGARIGGGASIGKNCTIAPHVLIPPGAEIPASTVVYGNNLKMRRDQRDIIELKRKAQMRQIDVLRKMIASNPAKFQ